MATPDDRDFSKPRKSALHPAVDTDVTPIEGTQVAYSLRAEMTQLRDDFRAHALIDSQGLEAIRVKQETQAGHITGIMVETAKQTVMLENMRDINRRAEVAAEARRARRHGIAFEIGKGLFAAIIGVVLGYLTHRYFS